MRNEEADRVLQKAHQARTAVDQAEAKLADLLQHCEELRTSLHAAQTKNRKSVIEGPPVIGGTAYHQS